MRAAIIVMLSVGVVPLNAGAQDWFNRCMSNPSGFAQEANLNTAAAQRLSDIESEIRISDDVARMSGLAGLGDRAMQARSRSLQYKQELQSVCSQLSQSIIETQQRQQRALADQAAIARAKQESERRRLATIEYELNRRVPGATDLMNEKAFDLWLDGAQGKTLRRDAWDQAIVSEKFDRAAQMLRDYKSKRQSKKI